MKPSHLCIVGATGSGKTSLARMLVDDCPRVVVMDHSEDQIWDTLGGTLRDPAEGVEFMLDRARSDYQLVLRHEDPEAYLTHLGALYDVHTSLDLPPLVVVMEEATVWSDTHEIPPELEAVATRGRRAGIVLVSIAQETTQLNPTLRRQAFLLVTLRQHSIPQGLRKQLRGDVDRVLRLAELDPWTTPRYGEHYLTVPPEENPRTHLLRAVQGGHEPLPPDYRPPTPE